MLKAVIFDLDGLLVDSTPVQEEAFRRFVEGHGKVYLPGTSGQSGKRIIDIIREYKDLYDLPGNIGELYKERQNIFYRLVNQSLQMFPGALRLLDKLKQKRLELALATSGDNEYIKVLFRKYPEMEKYFSVVITSEDVARGKPFPDVFQKALNRLGLKPEDAVVIEDSINGILAAKAAGILTICVPNRHFPDADVSIADRIFPSLEDIAQAIN